MISITEIRDRLAGGDRTAIIILGVGIVLAAAIWQLFAVPQTAALDEASAEQDVAQEAYDEVESRIAAVEEGSEDSILYQYDQGRSLDQLIPDGFQIDTFEQDLPDMLDRNGLATPGVNRAAAQQVGESLNYLPYNLRVTGTPEGIRGFLTDLERYPRLISLELSGLTRESYDDTLASVAISLSVYYTSEEQLEDENRQGEPLPVQIYE